MVLSYHENNPKSYAHCLSGIYSESECCRRSFKTSSRPSGHRLTILPSLRPVTGSPAFSARATASRPAWANKAARSSIDRSQIWGFFMAYPLCLRGLSTLAWIIVLSNLVSRSRPRKRVFGLCNSERVGFALANRRANDEPKGAMRPISHYSKLRTYEIRRVDWMRAQDS